MEKLILNRLKIVLVEKHITNKQLAKVLDKTQSTVSQWCTNDKQPSLETFYHIAKYLDVDLKDLFVSTKNK
ncbi:MAG: helix-turn-helix transcriptional regulator [Chitinophaga sp.]|uniref:helix-turn-helix transcriptional regulator n=1 Tax=Chitinophaga sp. TaxID=1869181 RepID=UPI001AFF6CBD|nr:helix-turn-helix transcriptional regulator [Chitinophaga sp.]MBO9730779.1 helix-turn-helix transcriptional regulator [Chitinophaga sp.]